jgi:hypothetical protein
MLKSSSHTHAEFVATVTDFSATMSVMRKTDKTQKRYARGQDRIICEGEHWFVRTREGKRGPFRSRREAQAEARLYVDTMVYLNGDPVLPEGVDRDDVTVVNMDHIPWS